MDESSTLAEWFTNPAKRYMNEAIKQAKKAFDADEVPVGAVVVYDGHIIARAYNQVEMLQDATAHAEMIALTQASAVIGNWRLNGATLIVTKEPCPMCCGAMVNARLGNLIYGVTDKRYGEQVSGIHILSNTVLNHQVDVISGVMEVECGQLLRSFFSAKRNK